MVTSQWRGSSTGLKDIERAIADAESNEGPGRKQRAIERQRGGAEDSRPQNQHSPEVSRYRNVKELYIKREEKSYN